MKKVSAGETVLTLLGRLTPPVNVVHVGAGAGIGYLHQWHTWDLNQAIVVDAGAELLAWTEAKAGQDTDWHAIKAVVGARNEQRPFYTAGNPDESSLVPPESLQYIWPGLKQAGQSDAQVQTLDTALANAGILIPRDNIWLMIDCFCAADIVQGGASLLPACSLVCARVLNSGPDLEDELLHTSTLDAMASVLEPQGFRFVYLHHGLNPAAGHVFFVRDWQAQQVKHAETLGQEKAVLEKTIKEIQDANKEVLGAKAGLEQQLNASKKEVEAKVTAEKELRRQLEEHQKQVQQITEQKDALQQQLTQKEQQHTEVASQLKQRNESAAALTKERDQLKQQLEAAQQEHKQAREQAAKLQQEKDQVSQQHAQQVKHAETLGQEKAFLEKTIKDVQGANKEVLGAKAGLEQQLNASKKEVETKVTAEKELRKQLEEHQKQVQQLTEQKDALQQQLTQKEQQHTEVASQLKQKNESAAALTNERDQLKQETADAHQRQQLLQEELTRAEAQIDLIKDLLLREQGLED